MGIYDRDYYREQPQGLSLRGPRTVVGILILLNVLVYLADLIFWPQSRWLSERLLCLSNHTLWQPYLWWQFLTYGFAHGEWPGHIVFNMLQLWFLGRAVEVHYGRAEFLRFYLASLIVGGVIWALRARFARWCCCSCSTFLTRLWCSFRFPSRSRHG